MEEAIVTATVALAAVYWKQLIHAIDEAVGSVSNSTTSSVEVAKSQPVVSAARAPAGASPLPSTVGDPLADGVDVSAIAAWYAALLASLQTSAVTAVPHVTTTWGSGTTWVPPTYYVANGGGGGAQGDDLRVGADGKVHGVVPDHVPADWTTEDLEQWEADLEQSIALRQAEQVKYGEEGKHRKQIGDELRLLRQIRKILSGSWTKEAVMESGDVLLQRLLAGDPDDDLPYELVQAIWAGYPKERLRLLLASDHDTTIGAAAWILSELGDSATALLADAAPLLTHRESEARFYALDMVLNCAGAQDGAILAQATLLSDDLDPRVQWKALLFLTRLPSPLLEVARAALPDRFRALVQWLLDADVGTASTEEMRTLLRDPDPLQRRFAAVALARSRNRAALLAMADEITDPLIQDFARTMRLLR